MPSRLRTPNPPSWPIRMAVVGETTESIGAASSGKSKMYASIRHCSETSSSPRVRRDGTIVMSSKAKARSARLLRPTSNMGLPPRQLRIIGRFDGHLDVVRVGLPQTCGGDPNERAALLQFRDRRGSGVEHGLSQTTDQLVRHRCQGPAIGNMAFDALGDQHRVGGDIGLEVAILGIRRTAATTGGHCAERSHAAIGLELLAIDEDQLAGALVAAGKQ